jgi:hypothetical protein
VSLERGSHFAPLGLEHAGEHQDRKSQQGKGRYDCKHRRFSFRFALNSSGTAFVPKRVGISFNADNVLQMFRRCQSPFVLPMFFQPPVRPEVLEIPPIIL